MSVLVETESKPKRKRKPRPAKRPPSDATESMASDTDNVPLVEGEIAKEESWGEATRRARGFNATQWRPFTEAAADVVERIFGMGRYLKESKDAIKAKGDDWLDMFDPAKVDEPITFGGLTQRAAIDKAEDLLLIDRYSSELRSVNLRNLPATISGLTALARLEKKKPGTMAQAMTDGRIFADMTVRDVEALEWSEHELTTLFFLTKEEPRAAAPPKRAPQLTDSERAYRRHLEAYEAARFARSVNALELSGFRCHSVTCSLCGSEHRAEFIDVEGQKNAAAWMITHIDDTHAADKWFVGVRYVIERIETTPRAVVAAPVVTPVPYDPAPIYATGSTRTSLKQLPASSVVQLLPDYEAARSRWQAALNDAEWYWDSDEEVLHRIVTEEAERDAVVAEAIQLIEDRMPWYRCPSRRRLRAEWQCLFELLEDDHELEDIVERLLRRDVRLAIEHGASDESGGDE